MKDLEVLRKAVANWQQHRHGADADPGSPANMRYDEACDRLDAALASLPAPKPEGEWVLVRRGDFPAPLGKGHGFSADYVAGFNDCVRYVDDLVPATPKPPPMNDNAVAVNESAPVSDKPESAEAVGTISQSHPMMGSGFMHAFICKTRLPDGTKLYTAPPRPEASEPVVDRAGAVRLAQAAAYASHHTHDYLPHTAEEARNWQPHEWVVDAILAATLDAAPQQASAPVGVEGLVAEWRTTAARKRAHGSGVAVAEANGYDMAANGLERALAQQPAAVDGASYTRQEVAEAMRVLRGRNGSTALHDEVLDDMERVLAAALATRQQGGPQE